MDQGNFNINVDVINSDAIKKLKDINSQLYKAQAPIRAYQKELKKFNDLSGKTANLKKLQSNLNSLKGKFNDVKGVIGSVARPMMALFGVGSVAGVLGLAKSFATWGNEIRNTSALLAITSTQAIKLQQAGNLLGLNQTEGLKSFQDTQNSIQYGGNAKGQLADNILGITPNTDFATAQIKAMTKVNALLKSGKATASGLRELLKDAGLDEKLLGQDPARFARMNAIANQNAKDMAPYAKSAGQFSDKINEAVGRIDVLKTELASALEPVLGPILQKFIDWSKDNKSVTETMQSIADAAKSVGAWIQSIKIDDIKNGFDEFKKIAEGLVAAFIALKAISFVKWGADVVSSLAGVIKAVSGLGTATEAVTAGLAAPVAIVGGAAVAAGYGVYKGGSEVYHDFGTDKGVLEGRQAKMKDRYYGANRYTELEKNQLQFQVEKQFMDAGYSKAAAQGMAGNLRAESGFNTLAIGDNGHALGIGQFHADRQKAIEQFIGKKMENMSLEEQVRGVIHELQTSEKGANTELMNAKTVQQGTIAGLDYERPGEWLNSKRSMNSSSLAKRTKMAEMVEAPDDKPSQSTSSVTAAANIALDIHYHGHIPPKVIPRANPNISSVKTTTKGGIING